MSTIKKRTLFALLPLLSAGSAAALPGLPDVAVGVSAGSAGLGLQATVDTPLPLTNLRAQYTAFHYDSDFEEDGVAYEAELKLSSLGAYLDFYPFARVLRVSAGLVLNGNKINAEANCIDGCEVGDLEVSGSDARLSGDLGFEDTAPYLGIGFSNPMVGSPFYLGFDLGVLFQGAPQASLAASGTADVTDDSGNTRSGVDLATDPDVQTALESEEKDLSDDLKEYEFYPVVMLSLGWRF